ncbi:MAG: DNA cytosine methyltransferase [Nanoarchaeota archaeon]|nr:DNA cytosine methyltransferase [Nanoarchaeota archaeon]MBU4451804.1 DNA cytosine methyltransferase [Nanoarchaeota archaeon]MCG2723467.1 DNA cytosine methyltransferase [archaeon]
MERAFKFIDLFAGIGGIRIPFEELGGLCVFSSEFDSAAQKMYEANFGEMPKGDITKIPSSEIPDHDLLLAGFPCQPFSIIGKGLGFADTRGTLFFEIERILKEKEPEAFLLENVKRLASHDKGRTFKAILFKLEQLGYQTHWKVLNALDYGLPQKRERVIIVGFKKNYPFTFPEPLKREARLIEIIESHDMVDKKYFASEDIVKKRLAKIGEKKVPKPSIWHENKEGHIGVHEYSCALRSGASHNYLLVDGIRRLTPREQLLLQGFPKSFKMAVPDAQIKKLAGNSVPVNMIREVAKRMIAAMRSEPLPAIIATKNGCKQTSLQMVMSY